MKPSSFVSWTETTLGAIRLLRGLPDDTLLRLGAACVWERHPAGHRLVTARDASRQLLFLTSGSVRMRMRARGSSRELGAGTTIGLLNAFAKDRAEIDVHALAPVTVGRLQRDDLADAMTRCPHLAATVARALSARRLWPPSRTDDREALDGRIATGLIVAGARDLRADGIARLTTLPEFAVWAALLGVSEADVRRSFARLERAGMIKLVVGERLHIDVPRLKALVGNGFADPDDPDAPHL